MQQYPYANYKLNSFRGDSVIGACSLCGGNVTLPSVWAGVIAPVPTCNKCGAVKKQPKPPVIEMEKP